jgi:predicted neutral ceramidase superfamily lipid hydrolase
MTNPCNLSLKNIQHSSNMLGLNCICYCLSIMDTARWKGSLGHQIRTHILLGKSRYVNSQNKLSLIIFCIPWVCMHCVLSSIGDLQFSALKYPQMFLITLNVLQAPCSISIPVSRYASSFIISLIYKPSHIPSLNFSSLIPETFCFENIISLLLDP